MTTTVPDYSGRHRAPIALACDLRVHAYTPRHADLIGDAERALRDLDVTGWRHAELLLSAVPDCRDLTYPQRIALLERFGA